MPFNTQPGDELVGVAWISSGVFILLQFVATEVGTQSNVVKVTFSEAKQTKEFEWNNVKTQNPNPGGEPGTAWFAWHIVSPAYIIGSDGGSPPHPAVILSGYTGASSLEMALTGKNIHGVNQNDLWFPAVNEAAASALVAELNAADAIEWNLFVGAMVPSSNMLRHFYTTGSQAGSGGEPGEPSTETKTVILIKDPTTDENESTFEFSVTQECTLSIFVYPTKRHIVFPGDASGSKGEPLFPIRQKDKDGNILSGVPPTIWQIMPVKVDPGGGEAGGGSSVVAATIMPGTKILRLIRDKYKPNPPGGKPEDNKPIVQLYSTQFRYSVVTYKPPDSFAEQGPPQWENIIGRPPLL